MERRIVFATSHEGARVVREREILALVSGGCSNREIAATLTISIPTVATHLRHNLDKLGVENRAAAAAWAVRQGLA